ncbi:MAG: ZIP family metal transporter [Nitrospirae bacterium]|nr:ZIP family metal transporter [Nitrospirota bacterium]
MEIWIYTLGSVLIISIISFIGILGISVDRKRLKNILIFLVSFAIGGLFGDAFIHLLPEAFEKLGTNLMTSLYVLLGILIFFVLEKFIRWRHCHIPTSEEHPHPLVTMNLIGDTVHNFIDGLLIGASYTVSIPIGITTALAVVLHEIPQEIGDFGVLLHGGLSIRKAMTYNFLSALSAVLGAVISLIIGSHIEGYTLALLPVTAGGFLYIAGSDLIPELHHEVRASRSFWQLISIIMGIGVMALLLLLE